MTFGKTEPKFTVGINYPGYKRRAKKVYKKEVKPQLEADKEI